MRRKMGRRWADAAGAAALCAVLSLMVGGWTPAAAQQSSGAQASTAGGGDAIRDAETALAAFNDSVRGAICTLDRGRRVIYGRGQARDAIAFQDGRVTYRHQTVRARRDESRAAKIQTLAYAAKLEDLDLAGVPDAALSGDCRAIDLYCKEERPDCLVETRSTGGRRTSTLTSFVEINLPSEAHVERFTTLFKAAAEAVGQ